MYVACQRIMRMRKLPTVVILLVIHAGRGIMMRCMKLMLLVPRRHGKHSWHSLLSKKSHIGRNLNPLFHKTSVSTNTTTKSAVDRAGEAVWGARKYSSVPQEPTIFSKILSKEIPADIIHEDQKVTTGNL